MAGEAIKGSGSTDSLSDALGDGCRFRSLTVIDDVSREARAVDSDHHLPASRVIRSLVRVAAWRGYPATRRLDPGHAFVALARAAWAERQGIRLDVIEPGRAAPNGVIERFNGRVRRGPRHARFRKLTDIRGPAELWRADYHRAIPHDSLGEQIR